MHEHPPTTDANGYEPLFGPDPAPPPDTWEVPTGFGIEPYEDEAPSAAARLRRYALIGFGVAVVLTAGVIFLARERAASTAAPAWSVPFPPDPAGDAPPVQNLEPATPWTGSESEGRLYVLTYPPDALVIVGLDTIGATPVSLQALRTGLHRLSIRKDGFVPYDTTVIIAGGETTFHHAELRSGRGRAAPPLPEAPTERPAAPSGGTLAVQSDPPGAGVWVDGERVGETPLRLAGLAPGQHHIAIAAPGRARFTEEVEVVAGESRAVNAVLGESVGTLTVLVRPWGSIYIDDELHRRDTDAGYQVELPAGTHRIEALHPTLGAVERTVSVIGGQSQRLILDLMGGAEHLPAGSALTAAPSPTASSPAPPPERRVYDLADVPPQLIGGLEGLHRKARYPEKAHTFGIEGRVFLQFVVDAAGQVRDAEVVRGLGMGCDEEALRVIREARFVPGTVGGEPVAVRHALSLQFQIDAP